MHGLPDAPEPTGSIYVSTYPWTILPLYSCLMAYPGNSTDQRIHRRCPGPKDNRTPPRLFPHLFH
jgi:hypothetical protein